MPEDDEIREGLSLVDYKKLKLSGNRLAMDEEGQMIDLGAVAKGYISGRLKEYLRAMDCDSAVINLGGNVSTLGRKPDGSYFRVGVQKPFSDRGETAAVVEMGEGCVISSGTYERCFEQDGRLYHHILSAKTGYPAETGLTQATVIGSDDMLCDTLSTVCILLGKERAENVIADEGYDVRVIFTGDDGSMVMYDPKQGERSVAEGETILIKDS